MTSATDELRRLLDERGVEWAAIHDTCTSWEIPVGNQMRDGFRVPVWYDGTLHVECVMSPTQAIAATLGATDAKPTRAESSGTLTAEKVRELMEDNSRQYPSPFDPYVWITEYDWQAIADELNATLGRGTCKMDDFADVPFRVDYEIEGYDMGSGRDYATLAECSVCGAYIIVPPEYHHVLTCDGDEVYQPYRFCPNCGAKVVE